VSKDIQNRDAKQNVSERVRESERARRRKIDLPINEIDGPPQEK
jgi:hypothetical protein